MATSTLNYSTANINRNFRIKASGIDPNGNKINTLVGVSGLIALIGVDFANKFLEKAFNSLEDSTCCKLRRGIRITFYGK